MPQDNRINTSLSKATGLDVGPSESIVWKLLEALSGIPLDPNFYKNESRENIFMNTVPQIGILGLGSRLARPTANATRGLVEADPYGLSTGPMERRQFLDKAFGNTTRRATIESNKLFNAPEYLTTQEGFNKAANHAETLNKRFGWPNAVNNPESIGTWLDPNADQSLGPIMKLYEMFKEQMMRGSR